MAKIFYIQNTMSQKPSWHFIKSSTSICYIRRHKIFLPFHPTSDIITNATFLWSHFSLYRRRLNCSIFRPRYTNIQCNIIYKWLLKITKDNDDNVDIVKSCLIKTDLIKGLILLFSFSLITFANMLFILLINILFIRHRLRPPKK